MSDFSRRSFFAAGLSGLAAAHSFAQAPTSVFGSANDDTPFAPSTLFLTWHRDPTTTMTVQWVGTRGETSDTTVYYRPVKFTLPPADASLIGPALALSGAGWKPQKTTVHGYHPSTDLKVFRAEINGLTPGTDYEFKVGKQSPTYRFATMPAKATDAIHFVSGGDCGVNPHAVANNIQAARQDPMFAVIGGDLAYDNGKSVATNLAFLRNYSKHMVGKNGRLIPMLAGIGNHEVDGGYGTKRDKAPFFYSLFDSFYPDTGYATLDFGEYLSLIFLDTGHTSNIGGDQADWLERELKERKDHPHVIVVNHVPAYPSARSMEGAKGKAGTGEENRKHWVPLFEKYRVPVVLEHHDHTFKRTKPLIDGMANDNGVLYLGDGSWGRIRSLQKPEKLAVMAATNQDYHLSLHRLQGDERFHLALDENGRVMDAARSGQRKADAIPVAR